MKIRIRFREGGESNYAREFLSSLNLDPARWEEEQVADSLATPTGVIFGIGLPLDDAELGGAETWECHFESDRGCSRFCVNGRVVAARVSATRDSEADLTETLSRLPEDLSRISLEGSPIGNLDVIARMTHLTRIILQGCSALTDIGALSALTRLIQINLRGCTSLADLGPLRGLTHLRSVDLSECKSLTDLRPISNLDYLKVLSLRNCSSLTDLQPLSGLKRLNWLNLDQYSYFITNLSALSSLTELTWLSMTRTHPSSLGFDLTVLSSLVRLRSLKIDLSKSETELGPLSGLTQLTSLELSNCRSLMDLGQLSNLTNLTSLKLSVCHSLTDIRPLAHLDQIKELILHASPVTDLSPLAGISQLELLDLPCCDSITDLTPLSSLKQLKRLNLGYCNSIINLTPLCSLKRLTKLSLERCKSLIDLTPISGLKELKWLNLGMCESITQFGGLSELTELRSLNLSDTRLTDVNVLSPLIELTHLDLSECGLLKDLNGLSSLAKLRSLNLSKCSSVSDIRFLSSLSELEDINIWELRRLRSIECLRHLASLRKVESAFHPSVVAELLAHTAVLRTDRGFVVENASRWLREAIAFTDGQPFEQERFAATLGEAFSLLGEHEIVPRYQAFLDSRPDFSAVPWKSWLQGCAKNRGHDVMAREVERVPPERLSPGGVGGRCAVLPGGDAPPDWQDWARDWLGRLERAQSSRAQQLLPVSAELCLAHARLGLREALQRWLKRFTDPSDTAALDPVQAALGEWQLRQGDTRAALAHALAVQQPGCRDPLLVRLVEAMHGDEAEQAGEILLRIESESLRRDLALKLVQLDSFAALPANMERLIVACGSSPVMLAELIRLAAPGADPSHLSALSNRLRSSTMDADR